jgi:hypothetical protein
MPIKGFQRGQTPTFICQCCKRRTRDTEGDDRFCGPCYELLGMQNSLWDDGKDAFVTDGFVPVRDKLLAKLVKLGATEGAVRAYMPDLFEVQA